MNGGPRFDLHVHSRHSVDSRESVEAILVRAAAIGLRGVALTDHNSVGGHAELTALAPRWPGLVLVPGVEVSTREGHLLLFGTDSVPRPQLPIREVLRWADDRNAVAVLAHPFRRIHGVGGRVASTAAVPALETLNGHNSPGANRSAERIRAARRLGATGGSDAHRAGEVGRCVTEFGRPIDSVSELLDELRAGRVRSEGREMSAGARLGLVLESFRRRVSRGLRPV